MELIDISRGKTLRKIKGLKVSISDYTTIKTVKQKYLNSLQHYSNYYTINIECYKIQQEIATLDIQLSNMEGKLQLLKKELE